MLKFLRISQRFSLLALLAAVLSAPAAQASTTINFNLPYSATTSAGVYDSSGTLIRTLWGGVAYSSGAHSAVWDGKDNYGVPVTTGAQVHVLYHNVTYTWDGVIGNTSASQTGANVLKALNPVWDLAFSTDGRGYFDDAYEEGNPMFGGLTQSNYQQLIPLAAGLHDYQRIFTLVAADTNKAYFVNSGNPQVPAGQLYITAVDMTKPTSSCVYYINNDCLVSFPDGTNQEVGQDLASGANLTANVIDLSVTNTANSTSSITGIAVQASGNLLFSAHRYGNFIKVFDKTSGALLNQFSVSAPGRMAVTPSGDLWVLSAAAGAPAAIHFAGSSLLSATPTLVSSITGFAYPLALAVSPDGGTLVVADGGPNQWLDGFDANTDAPVWTYGLHGGQDANGVAVAPNKFFFSNDTASDAISYSTYTTVARTYLAYSPDGRLWVGDPLNNRTLIYDTSQFPLHYNDELMYIPTIYSVAVDPNNPTRVFAGFQEFSVDYSQPLTVGGAPNFNAWSLVNNWSAGLNRAEYNGSYPLNEVITLSQGGVSHTYGLLQDAAQDQCHDAAVFELSVSTNLRDTGIRYAYKNQSNCNTQSYIESDGSLRGHFTTAGVGNAPGTQSVTSQPFQGFSNGNPVWQSSTTVIAVAPTGATDPYYKGAFVGASDTPRFPTTQSGLVVYFDQSLHGSTEPWPSAGLYNGMHLGAVPYGAGTGQWRWRASPSGPFNSTCVNASPSDCPPNNTYQNLAISTSQSGTYDDHNQSTQYGGNRVMTAGHNIIYGYHGEFWENDEANQWLHFFDDGLFVGQFGTQNVGFNGPSAAGSAGNAFSPWLTTVNGNLYLWHNDESQHSGVHRWQVNGWNSIQELIVPLVGTAPVPTAAFTSPANGSVFSSSTPITLSANASVSTGTIASVAFFSNGVVIGTVTVAPYTLVWSTAPAGTDVLTAKVTDGNGTVAVSTAVTITVTGFSQFGSYGVYTTTPSYPVAAESTAYQISGATVSDCAEATAVQSGTVLNVDNFGAKGDGLTDDTAAIQAAVNATPSGGATIVFTSGKTYVKRSEVMVGKSSVTLWGYGAVIYALATDQDTINTSSGPWLDFQVTGQNFAAYGLTIVSNNRQRPARGLPFAAAIYLNASSGVRPGNVRIADNRFEYTVNGVLNYGASGYVYNRNVVYRTWADSLYNTDGANNGLISCNLVQQNGDDMVSVVNYGTTTTLNPALDVVNQLNLTIRGNDVENNYWGRGITVSGGGHVSILGNYISNVTSAAGILVTSENGAYTTENAHDVLVQGNTILNIEKTAPSYNPRGSWNPAVHGAIMLQGQASNHTVSSVTVAGNTVSNVAYWGTWLNGNVSNSALIDDAVSGAGYSPPMYVSQIAASTPTFYCAGDTVNGSTYGVSGCPPLTVAISAPASGASVSGAIVAAGTVSVSNVGVSSVSVVVDAGAFSLAAGTSPWTYAFDTSSLINGAHVLTVVASDPFGGVSTGTVAINVANNSVVPSPLIVSSASLATAWTSSYPVGTVYYAVLSTGALPNSFAADLSSATANRFVAFAGMTPDTTYYAGLSTVAVSGPFFNLGSTATFAALPSSAPYVGVSSSAVTAVWAGNGNPAGTPYVVRISPSSGFATIAASSVTRNSSASFSGLQAGTTYYGEVAVYSVRTGTWTAFIPLNSTTTWPPAPGAPGTPSGAALGVSSVVWNWSAAQYASSYQTMRAETGAVLASTPTLAYDDVGLLPNTAYGLQVRGVDVTGAGALSPSATRYTLAEPPSGAVATSVAATSATLSWSLNSNPAGTDAEVQRSTDDVLFLPVASSVTTTSFTDYGLLGCTTYYYRVRNANGDGVPTAFDAAAGFVTSNTLTLPATNLSAQAVGGGRIALNWSPSPTEGVVGYRLFYDSGAGTVDYAAPLASLSGSATSYLTSVLPSSAAYVFALRTLQRCGGMDAGGVFAIAASTAAGALNAVRADIVGPGSGHHIFGDKVTVYARLVAGGPAQVEQVIFQYRPTGTLAWSAMTAVDAAHPNPATSAPYFVHWNVEGLAPGSYDLSAVAVDVSGSSDPVPDAVTVIVDPVAPDLRETAAEGLVQTFYGAIANTFNSGGGGIGNPLTSVTIPGGLVDGSTASVTIVAAGTPPATPVPAGFALAPDLLVSVILSNGQSFLNGGTASVSFFTPVSPGLSPTIFSYNTTTQLWAQDVATTYTPATGEITGLTPHFTVFAVLAGGGAPTADLSGVRVYPIPYRPNGGNPDQGGGNTGIVFDQLPASAAIKIYTASGQLVTSFDASSPTGKAVWNAQNDRGRDVASGLYLAVITSPGVKSVTKKILVIR